MAFFQPRTRRGDTTIVGPNPAISLCKKVQTVELAN